MSEIRSRKRKDVKVRKSAVDKSNKETKIDKTEQQIEAYLKITFEKMLRDGEILKERPEDFSIEDAVQKIGETFEANMRSERENYLRELILRLSNTYQECIDIRDKYEETKKGVGMTAIDISKENEKLTEEIKALEERYNALKTEKQAKEKAYKESLSGKKQTLKNINMSIEEMQAAQQSLAKQVEGLKSSMLKIRGGQKRMIKQVKSMILSEIEKVIDNNQQREKEMHDQKIQRLDAAISAEKAEQKRLQRQCQMALDAIYSISPQELSATRITVDELPSRIEDVKDVISKSIEYKKSSAIKKMRQDIAQAIPGIDVSSGNIIDAINRNLEEKLRQKEEECKRIIRKGEERERLLKEKLEEALSQIKELQDGPGAHLDILDDVEKQKSIWEANRDKLDAKMSALSLGTQ